MNLREQLEILLTHHAEFIVVGGQAGVLRQVIEFSHDLDILISATPENAERVRKAVQQISGQNPDVDLLLGRDFQQYIDVESGTEIDIHLKLIAIPDFSSGARNASLVDVLGVSVPVLELPALYASKRTDRPRDAVHRLAIEDRLRRMVLDDAIEVDEVILACCLDPDVARAQHVAPRLSAYAAATHQGLLQARLIAYGEHIPQVEQNPALHPTVRSLLTLTPEARAKLVGHGGRLAALLARIPLILPEAGYRVRYVR